MEISERWYNSIEKDIRDLNERVQALEDAQPKPIKASHIWEHGDVSRACDNTTAVLIKSTWYTRESVLFGKRIVNCYTDHLDQHYHRGVFLFNIFEAADELEQKGD